MTTNENPSPHLTHTSEDVTAMLLPYMSEYNAGFFPPDGWLDLVVELHRKLIPNPDYRIGQVKEKFGGLRFYVDGLTDAEQELVDAAEQESYLICQQCGSRDDVEMRHHGWYATLCARCDSGSDAPRGYDRDV